MQHFAAFHLGLHYLQKHLLRGFPEYKGLNVLVQLSSWSRFLNFDLSCLLEYYVCANREGYEKSMLWLVISFTVICDIYQNPRPPVESV